MSVRQSELGEHTRFGMLPLREPSSYLIETVFRPETRCRCGCNREIVEGCYNWSGDFYYDKDCIINDLINSKEMKIVDYKEAV